MTSTGSSTSAGKRRAVLVEFPSTYTVDSLRRAFATTLPDWQFATSREELKELGVGAPDLQWSDYDEIDWDEVMEEGRMVNSYVIRKSLIRKNHLSHTLAMYLAKNPTSPLRQAVLKTFQFQLSFPDELDELLQDDLYELDEAFSDADVTKWWILKAALADKGNGIRLFSRREALEEIFEEFDLSDDEDEEEQGDEADAGQDAGEPSSSYGESTRVSASQMREWVIQEYVASPLLLDPALGANLTPQKFHLRVYVVAVGALVVYVQHPYLALFAPTPYALPNPDSDEPVDLSSHLTNTCLQTGTESEPESIAVRTLQGMMDEEVLSGPSAGERLGTERVKLIEGKVCEAVAETFKAGVSAGSGFQVLPNAFEIFGLDFLVDDTFSVSLLEINACPDFTQTGKELESIIDDLFASTLKVAVVPFFAPADAGAGERVPPAQSGGLRRVLDLQVSKAW